MRRLQSLIALWLLLCSPATVVAALSNTFQQSGNLGLEVAATAGGNTPITMGTLTLSLVPPGAVIVRATLHASEVNNPLGLNCTFAGQSPGALGPPASDASFITMYEYSWNVTPYVIAGVPSYTFMIGQAVPASFQISAVALVVVWRAPGEPYRTIAIFDGMQQVGESGPETESISFGSLPAGPSTVWVVTAGDDSMSTGETVDYNGGTIGGPLDKNLGFSASLLQMNATSQSGTNTLAINTGADHMGWMIGAVSVTTPATPAISSSWGRIKSLYR